MLRFINSFKPSLYSGFRCWFLHCILRQAVDFYDVECINCTMPIGAAEMHQEYPMAICSFCQSYTTVAQVLADDKEYESLTRLEQIESDVSLEPPKRVLSKHVDPTRQVIASVPPPKDYIVRIVSKSDKPLDDRGDYKFPTS